jgi:flavin-dependent dehydrogenase
VVLGGGPAGSAAALTLLRYSGFRVTLIESTGISQQRIGEVVSPAMASLLAYLGVDGKAFLQDHLSAHEHIATWGSDVVSHRNSIHSLLGSGWHLDRNAFDTGLLREVECAGGEVNRGSRLSELYLALDNKWEIAYVKDGASCSLSADFIIDATGKKSVLPRRFGIKKRYMDRLIGLTAFFGVGETQHFMSVEANPYGWWYSAALPGQRIAVALMTDSDIAAACGLNRMDNWERLLGSSAHTAGRLAHATGPSAHTAGRMAHVHPQSRLFVRPAQSQILEVVAGNRWIAAGDSAVSFDPLSALGIGHAMSSGIEAARAIMAHFRGDDSLFDNYARVLSETFQKTLATQREFYRREQRWKDFEFWKRRHE